MSVAGVSEIIDGVCNKQTAKETSPSPEGHAAARTHTVTFGFLVSRKHVGLRGVSPSIAPTVPTMTRTMTTMAT